MGKLTLEMYRALKDLDYYVNFYTVYLYERLSDSRDSSRRAGSDGLTSSWP
jgi:hypothetical protein